MCPAVPSSLGHAHPARTATGCHVTCTYETFPKGSSAKSDQRFLRQTVKGNLDALHNGPLPKLEHAVCGCKAEIAAGCCNFALFSLSERRWNQDTLALKGNEFHQ